METDCGRSGSDFSDGLGSEGLSEGGRKILKRIRFRISGQSQKIPLKNLQKNLQKFTKKIDSFVVRFAF